jgi:hypothetical protein
VKKVLLQKLMYLAVIVKLSTTLLEMQNPIERCILDLKRKTILYSTAVDMVYKHTRSV